MKRGIFILSLMMLFSACSTSSEQSSLFGVWVWEDVDVTESSLVLKKHVLTLLEGDYYEAFFENSKPRGQEEGTLLISRDEDNVEFATTGNIQTVYKGQLSGDFLIINSINDKSITPPALYRRG